MSTFRANGKTFRYRDIHVPGDLNHCYRPDCQDIGKPLVDFVGRWENVGSEDSDPADAVLYTCINHSGAEFEEAKSFFGMTQKSTTAAYFTQAELEKRWK